MPTQVETVTASLSWGGQDGSVNAQFVIDGDRVILIDTLMQGLEATLDQALDARQLDWSDVTDVVITHDHPDHTGGLAHVLERAPQAVIHASREVLAGLADGAAQQVVGDGDQIASLQVYAVPGHTGDSICLYETTTGALVVGDSAGVIDGRLSGPQPGYTADMGQAEQSLDSLLARLSGQPLTQIHFGHQDAVTSGVAQLVTGWRETSADRGQA